MAWRKCCDRSHVLWKHWGKRVNPEFRKMQRHLGPRRPYKQKHFNPQFKCIKKSYSLNKLDHIFSGKMWKDFFDKKQKDSGVNRPSVAEGGIQTCSEGRGAAVASYFHLWTQLYLEVKLLLSLWVDAKAQGAGKWKVMNQSHSWLLACWCCTRKCHTSQVKQSLNMQLPYSQAPRMAPGNHMRARLVSYKANGYYWDVRK